MNVVSLSQFHMTITRTISNLIHVCFLVDYELNVCHHVICKTKCCHVFMDMIGQLTFPLYFALFLECCLLKTNIIIIVIFSTVSFCLF